MAENVSVEIAKISFRQAVVVAVIALFGGISTTLLNPANRERTAQFVSGLITGKSEPAGPSTDTLNERILALQKAVTQTEREKRDLYDRLVNANGEIGRLELAVEAAGLRLSAIADEKKLASRKASKSKDEVERLTEELNATRQLLREARMNPIDVEFRPSLYSALIALDDTDDCAARGERSFKQAGGTSVRRDGNAVFANNGQYNMLVQCIPSARSAMIVTAGPDGTAARNWGDQLRTALRASNE